MNKVCIIGNLTRAPEKRVTQEGTPVCTFTVAVNRRTNAEHPEADFFRVAAWRELGENCAMYLDKGKKVCVMGSVRASAYIGRDNTPHASLEVQAESVEFLSPKEKPDEFTQVDEPDDPYKQ